MGTTPSINGANPDQAPTCSGSNGGGASGTLAAQQELAANRPDAAGEAAEVTPLSTHQTDGSPAEFFSVVPAAVYTSPTAQLPQPSSVPDAMLEIDATTAAQHASATWRAATIDMLLVDENEGAVGAAGGAEQVSEQGHEQDQERPDFVSPRGANAAKVMQQLLCQPNSQGSSGTESTGGQPAAREPTKQQPKPPVAWVSRRK